MNTYVLGFLGLVSVPLSEAYVTYDHQVFNQTKKICICLCFLVLMKRLAVLMSKALDFRREM